MGGGGGQSGLSNSCGVTQHTHGKRGTCRRACQIRGLLFQNTLVTSEYNVHSTLEKTVVQKGYC